MGIFEARTTPVVRTSDTGGFGEKIVPGSYSVTIQAPGFGAQTFKNVTVPAGATKSLAFTAAPNLASLASGASIVSASSEDAGLPAEPATISTIQVSAFKNTTSARFAALKNFTFQVSDDGVLWRR